MRSSNASASAASWCSSASRALKSSLISFSTAGADGDGADVATAGIEAIGAALIEAIGAAVVAVAGAVAVAAMLWSRAIIVGETVAGADDGVRRAS